MRSCLWLRLRLPLWLHVGSCVCVCSVFVSAVVCVVAHA